MWQETAALRDSQSGLCRVGVIHDRGGQNCTPMYVRFDPKATAGHQNAIRSSFQSVDCYLCANRYGYPRHRGSARRGDPGRRPARAQPRSAGKQTGVRTLGLVCLGSALAVLSIHAATGTEESRVIQGIVTGVGHSSCRRHRQFLARASLSCAAGRHYQFA